MCALRPIYKFIIKKVNNYFVLGAAANARHFHHFCFYVSRRSLLLAGEGGGLPKQISTHQVPVGR
jgi:hypothetical protein